MFPGTNRSALRAFLLLVSTAAAVAADAVPSDPKLVKPLAVGAKAPSFVAQREDGSDYSFDGAALARPTVLIFYRGGWCPFCNANLSELRNAQGELKERGFDVVFFSADRPQVLRSSLKEPHPGYTLVSDAKGDGARALGIAYRMDDATYAQYKAYGIDLEKLSGNTLHQLPVPAVFIIDQRGYIRFVYANPDYKVRLKGDELLQAAREVTAAPQS